MRKRVAREYIIDAVVAAVADGTATGQLIDIPGLPEIDPTGLSMRMALPTLP